VTFRQQLLPFRTEDSPLGGAAVGEYGLWTSVQKWHQLLPKRH